MEIKRLFFALSFLISTVTYGQVGIGTTSPDQSAVLELDSTTQGLLIPRMTTAQRNNISSPATGLMVFDDDLNTFYYFDGSNWIALSADNLGNHTATQNLQLGTNYLSGDGDSEGIVVDSDGNVGIGTTTPEDKLHVDGSIRMVDGNQTAGYIPVSDANGTMTWTDPTTIPSADDGDWTIDGNDVYTAVTGNVGIGTTTPAAELDVNGELRISELQSHGFTTGSNVIQVQATTDSDQWLRFRKGGGAPNGEAGVIFSFFNTDHFFVNNVDDALAFSRSTENSATPDFANSNELMRLAANGNMGIGINNPGAKLDVAGSIRMQDGNQAVGYIPVSDANGTMTWTDPGTIKDNLGDHTATQNIQTNGNWLSNDGDNEGIYISDDGKVAVTTDGSDPDPSAMLEVKSTDKGFLPPRMTQAQRDAIPSTATGLVVWCSNCGDNGELQVYNGTEWTNMVGDPASVYTPAVGDFYGGGVVFYIFQSGDPGYVEGETHGLICAVSDQTGGSGIQWYNGSFTTTGATGTAIGTGQANTTTIISNQGAGTYAATVCTSYVGGGFTDWFLPSKDELNLMYQNKATINATAGANGGISFASNYYWSSTESSSSYAWRQYFGSGFQYFDDKYNTNRVRAVRAF